MPNDPPMGSNDDEYEILPHKDVEDLKDEIRRMKEFEVSPTKKSMASMIEVSTKMDKMNSIFEEAMHELKAEEGGLSFQEKMRPVIERMNKILEQNSEIAQGIVAIADMVKDLREELTTKGILVKEQSQPVMPMMPQPLPPGLPSPPPPPPQYAQQQQPQQYAPPQMPPARPPLGAAAFPAPGMPPANLPPLPRQAGLPLPPPRRPPA